MSNEKPMRSYEQLDAAVRKLDFNVTNLMLETPMLKSSLKKIETHLEEIEAIKSLAVKANLQKMKFLNLDELCLYLGYKKNYAYKLNSEGKLPRPVSGRGSKVIFARKEIDKWITTKKGRRSIWEIVKNMFK